MYPYLILWWSKFYMTWIGIIVSFLVFLGIARYLTKKYHQNFWKFFYWLPFLIVLTYFLWSYVNFVFDVGMVPTTWSEFVTLLSPYGYKFHFMGLLIGMFISITVFLKKITRVENKKVWSDILFFSLALSLVPLWLFLLMGDNFIGTTTDTWLGIKSLHSDSQRNKFNLIYPIGLFLSLGSLFVVLYIKILKKKRFGYGMLGFAVILIFMSLLLVLQQYPRHAVFSLGNILFDLKQYSAWILAIICYVVYSKWKKVSELQ
ncbi:MAG: hypothetical protein ACD_80C00072G0002 [uncultured bacterium (gcode 4)]|uniref:Prolipoprotein diacylglyceryl transferase n=1 Tax=uncultured bacterium (gcode 4) TaxID=1234023 RepID=K1YJ17_9BACT|nr:MAG: hypothetical protein ACD_80C00072G0002 [uncultured bacterium (gcode 4)]